MRARLVRYVIAERKGIVIEESQSAGDVGLAQNDGDQIGRFRVVMIGYGLEAGEHDAADDCDTEIERGEPVESDPGILNRLNK